MPAPPAPDPATRSQPVGLGQPRSDLRDLLARPGTHRGHGENCSYGVFDAVDGALLAAIGLHDRVDAGAREIGYWVHADQVGKGIKTRSVAAVTQAALALGGIQGMEIHCDEANVRSIEVPRRLGYHLARTDIRPIRVPRRDRPLPNLDHARQGFGITTANIGTAGGLQATTAPSHRQDRDDAPGRRTTHGAPRRTSRIATQLLVLSREKRTFWRLSVWRPFEYGPADGLSPGRYRGLRYVLL
ncbi:MAG: GNAT family N-acetyltransferase [Pseudonocardiaceae bacterium]